jgi:hypothetical protein
MAVSTHIDRREENKKNVFSCTVPNVSKEKLEAYCELYEIPLNNLVYNSSYYIPGNLIEGLFRKIVKIISSEDKRFPINFLESFIGGNGGTRENRIFINETLTVWIDIKTLEETGPYISFLCGVDFNRGEEIVFSGIYKFIGEKI